MYRPYTIFHHRYSVQLDVVVDQHLNWDDTQNKSCLHAAFATPVLGNPRKDFGKYSFKVNMFDNEYKSAVDKGYQ